jgi:hypothetical protein
MGYDNTAPSGKQGGQEEASQPCVNRIMRPASPRYGGQEWTRPAGRVLAAETRQRTREGTDPGHG